MVPRLGSSVCLPWSRLPSEHGAQGITMWAVFAERIQDAISSLESIRNHPDVSLCSTMALIYAHKCCETIDREAIQELESSLKEIRKTASGTALYHAGLFLWLIGCHDKAKEYTDRLLKVSSSSREGCMLRGWVDLSSDKPHTVKKSIKYLEQGMQDTKDVLGLMGKAKYFMMLQNYSGALEVVNQITVTSGSFLPALVLKMQLFLARQDWEQTVETGHRILEKDESNIDACQILAVHELAREGNITTAAEHVRNLINALETREPQNPSLHLKKILVVSRLCGRHQVILRLVCSFIERTFRATSSYAHVATELGYLFILRDQVKEASLWYSEAMKLSKSGMAMTGITWCQILEGHLEEAEHQLEFLKEVQQSLGKSEVLVFLQALLASRKHKGEQEVTALLKEAAELHFSSMRALPLGSEYLERLDPLFLVCIAKEYLLFCPKQPRSPGQIVSPLLKQVTAILNPVVKVAPALIDPLYVMAQVKYLSGPRPPPLPFHQGQGPQQVWGLPRSHKGIEDDHKCTNPEDGRKQEIPRALSAAQRAGVHLTGTGGCPPDERGAARGHQDHAGRHQRVQRHTGGDPHHHRQRGLGPEQRERGPGTEHAEEHHAQAALLHGGQGEDGQHLPADPQGHPPLHRVLPGTL
uniref:Tetratricopeptide repeat domain 21A n=1 Tax=Sus scrofa TaxID=9823 RepID=A0A8D0SAD7_PIG